MNKPKTDTNCLDTENTLDLTTLYEKAINPSSDDRNDKTMSKNLLHKIINNYPDSIEAKKAKIYLNRLSKKTNNIRMWALAPPVIASKFIYSEGYNNDVYLYEGVYNSYLFLFLMAVAVFPPILLWLRETWSNCNIENPESRVFSLYGWLWTIGIFNTTIGALFVIGIWSTTIVDFISQITSIDSLGEIRYSLRVSSDQLLIGVFFLVIAIITTWTRNRITIIAACLAILVWSYDTAIVGVSFLFSDYYWLTPPIISLAFHLFILFVLIKGFNGLSGIVQLTSSIPLEQKKK